MEYKKDLLQNNAKSTFRLILGILFCVVSFARVLDNESISLFDWFCSLVFLTIGVIHIFSGLGISVERFFGKAFVHIDQQMIDIKLGVFEKEFKIDWREILSIECKTCGFTIQKRDNTFLFFPFSKLDYSSVVAIKDILSKLAGSKAISYNEYHI
jgi:hypothetical protein